MAEMDGTGGREAVRDGKVVVSFRNVGAAPALRQSKFKIDAEQRFNSVILFLRRQLQCADTDSLFVYVNSAFAPSPDELIADVARCFHTDGVLSLNYCTTPAWG